LTDSEIASNLLFMTTTQLSLSARRLLDYLDADAIRDDLPGETGTITANRPHLAMLIDELRLAVAFEDIEVGR
jgi:hypothetical protein